MIFYNALKLIFSLVLITLSLSCPFNAYAAQEAFMFFPILPDNAQEFTEPKIIPVVSNYDFGAKQNKRALSKITRAIIAVPDETRNAGGVLRFLSELAGSANSSTLIISPQFMIPADLLQFDTLPAEDKKYFALWNVSDWIYGNPSVTNDAQNKLLSNMHDEQDSEDTTFINQSLGSTTVISSFDVIDKLALFLAQKDVFPNLRTIIITGKGLGANFVQRYALFTGIPEEPLLSGISINFLAVGPTSYVYPTEYRPNMYKNKLIMDGVSESGYATQCKEMNDYPYGMDNLNSYARKSGKNASKLSYGLRAVTYVVAKGNDSVPDSGCQAMLQGSSGFERGSNYQQYLSSLYGEESLTNHVFSFISGNNDASTLYSSQCAVSVLFSNGICQNSNIDIPDAAMPDTAPSEELSEEPPPQSKVTSFIEKHGAITYEPDTVTKKPAKSGSGYLDGLDL